MLVRTELTINSEPGDGCYPESYAHQMVISQGTRHTQGDEWVSSEDPVTALHVAHNGEGFMDRILDAMRHIEVCDLRQDRMEVTQETWSEVRAHPEMSHPAMDLNDNPVPLGAGNVATLFGVRIELNPMLPDGILMLQSTNGETTGQRRIIVPIHDEDQDSE